MNTSPYPATGSTHPTSTDLSSRRVYAVIHEYGDSPAAEKENEMTSPPHPMRVHTCHADDSCGRPLRFQAYLEAAGGAGRVCESAEACSDHVGDMVQSLTDRARGQRLAGAQLRVFAIDRPADGSHRPDRGGQDGPDTLSLAVSLIRLTE